MKLLVPDMYWVKKCHPKKYEPKTHPAPSKTILTRSVTPGVEVSPLVTRALTPGGGASPAAALKVRCVLAHDYVIVSTNIAYYWLIWAHRDIDWLKLRKEMSKVTGKAADTGSLWHPPPTVVLRSRWG